MKCSDKFVLLYPVGSLMSSVMDSTHVKLHLCKTKCTVKAATNFAYMSGLRLHMLFLALSQCNVSQSLSIYYLFFSYCPVARIRI